MYTHRNAGHAVQPKVDIALVERPVPRPPKPDPSDLVAELNALKWCFSGMPRVVKMDSGLLEREKQRILRDIVVLADGLGIRIPVGHFSAPQT